MSGTITKTALIETLAQKTGISNTRAGEFLGAFLEEIQDNVAKGKRGRYPLFSTSCFRGRPCGRNSNGRPTVSPNR